MSLSSDIQTIVNNLYPDATFSILSNFRSNEESFYTETSALPFIVLYNEIVKNNEIKINNNVMKNHKLLILFLNLDDINNTDTQSQAIIDAMEGYADRVAVKIYQLEQVRLNPGARQKYKTTPLFRQFSSSLSGVALEMLVNYNTIVNF